MSNSSFNENLIKIGKTNRDPNGFRKDELYTTGVPEPFKVEYFALVENHNLVEKKLHRKFSKLRPNNKREFFRCSIPDAIIAIRELSIIDHEKVFYKSPHEIKQKQIEVKRKNDLEREKIIKEQVMIVHKALPEALTRSMDYLDNQPRTNSDNIIDVLTLTALSLIWSSSTAEGIKLAKREYYKFHMKFQKEKLEAYMNQKNSEIPLVYASSYIQECFKEIAQVCKDIKTKHNIPNRITRSEW